MGNNNYVAFEAAALVTFSCVMFVCLCLIFVCFNKHIVYTNNNSASIVIIIIIIIIII